LVGREASQASEASHAVRAEASVAAAGVLPLGDRPVPVAVVLVAVLVAVLVGQIQFRKV
jgi:hypothetical protein